MHQISLFFFQRGITPEREITQTRQKKNKKKKRVSAIFSMRNPYMKFQNPSMHVFWQTEERTDNPKPICPINFFEVGGIIMFAVSLPTHPKTHIPKVFWLFWKIILFHPHNFPLFYVKMDKKEFPPPPPPPRFYLPNQDRGTANKLFFKDGLTAIYCSIENANLQLAPSLSTAYMHPPCLPARPSQPILMMNGMHY